MFGGSMVDLSLTSLIMHISNSGVTKRVTVLIFGTQGAVLDQNISPLCHVASITLTPYITWMPLFQQFVSKAVFAALQLNHTCVKGFILFYNPITQIVMPHENNHSTLQSLMHRVYFSVLIELISKILVGTMSLTMTCLESFLLSVNTETNRWLLFHFQKFIITLPFCCSCLILNFKH